MEETETICTVVVTCNRKNLLLECLEALLNQTHPLDAIYIIDNASTDGTPEFLKEKGFIHAIPIVSNKPIELHKIFKNNNTMLDIFYIRMHENTGGAGGFYEGIKRGCEKGFDWLWLTDDDGVSDNNALENLLNFKNQIRSKAMNCLVVNKDNFKELAFPVRIGYKTCYNYDDLMKYDGNIKGGNFFNGTFISKDVITKVGLPNKNFFIKGDERDYYQRVKREFKIYTCKNAIIYHPKPVFRKVKVLFRNLLLEENDFKNYFYVRNRLWLIRKYNFSYYEIIKEIIKNILLSFFVRNKIKRISDNVKAINKGLNTSKKILNEDNRCE